MPGNRNKGKGHGRLHQMSTQKCTHEDMHGVTQATGSQNLDGNSNTEITETDEVLRQSRQVLYGTNTQNNITSDNKYESMNPQLVSGLVNTNNIRSTQDSNQYTYANTGQQYSNHANNMQSMHYTSFTNPNQSFMNMDSSMPPWAVGLCQQMNSIQSLLDGQTQRWRTVEENLSLQTGKLSRMEKQLTEISNIKQELNRTNLKVNDIQNQVKSMERKVTEYDDTINQYSDMYDDMATQNSETDTRLKQMDTRIQQLEQNHKSMNEQMQITEEKITDVRWRSMRENLLFFGIPEDDGNFGGIEDCEGKVTRFIRTEMGVERDIHLDRAHRLGRYSSRHARPRPIVAKFTYYKDKEAVRARAPQVLSGTQYGVSEHYPREIEEKRKQLYGVAKEYRSDERNRVRLVRDKLYVNGKLYDHKQQHRYQQTGQGDRTHVGMKWHKQQSAQSSLRAPHWQDSNTTESSTVSTTRTFRRSAGYRNTQVERTQGAQTFNRFAVLGDQTPVSRNDRPCDSRKKKAVSPLDTGVHFKKQHIDVSSDDEVPVSTETDIPPFAAEMVPSTSGDFTTAVDLCRSPMSTDRVMVLQPSPVVTLPGSVATGGDDGEGTRAHHEVHLGREGGE